MNSSVTTQASARSIELLNRAARPWGFAAASGFSHYEALWTRDAAMAVLGSYTTHDEGLTAAAAATLRTVASATDKSGRVPAVIQPDRQEWDWGEGGAVDASAWFVIMACSAWEATQDPDLAHDTWTAAERALRWLTAQDATGSGLISAAPSTDWMDSSLTRFGRTLHLNVLYAWAARSGEILANALGTEAPVKSEGIRERVNALFWPEQQIELETLYPSGFMHSATREAYKAAAHGDRSHYISHIVHAAFVDRCDVLANVLAILAGVAPKERGSKILAFLSEAGVDQPYPSKTWPEPIADSDPMWIRQIERHLDERWHNAPHTYHNGAVWPYVGALHAAASASLGYRDLTKTLLQRVAEANRLGDWRFSEWIHGATGEPRGAESQTWNAGAFLLASEVAQSGLSRLPGRPVTPH